MSDPSSALLTARALSLPGAGGAPGLAAVTLTLEAGECVVVLGHAASGKSALLRTLYGLDPAAGGELELLGVSLRSATEAQRLAVWRECGFVFPEGALLSNLTLRQNVELPLRYRAELSGREIAARTDGLLAELGIETHADARPAGLGLSVRKRAALGRALITRPRILFGDELLAAGDDRSLDLTCAALARARSEWFLAVLLAEPSATPSERLAPRFLALRDRTVQALPHPSARAHGPA